MFIAGPMTYELIQQNMPEALPLIRTVQSTIHSEYKIEGRFVFDELRELCLVLVEMETAEP